MQELGSYQRKAFIKDHPPVLARLLIGSTGSESTLLAGSVLGLKTADGKHYAYVAANQAAAILAEDVIVPATGDIYGLAYLHAAVVASELIWADGVSATEQETALAALRGQGIYANEA